MNLIVRHLCVTRDICTPTSQPPRIHSTFHMTKLKVHQNFDLKLFVMSEKSLECLELVDAWHVTSPQNLCACQSFDLGFRLSDLYKIFIAAKDISLDLSHQLDWMECVAVNPKTFMEGSYLTQILFDGLNKIFYYLEQLPHPRILEWSVWKGLNIECNTCIYLTYRIPRIQQTFRGKKADQHKFCKCPLRCSFFN